MTRKECDRVELNTYVSILFRMCDEDLISHFNTETSLRAIPESDLNWRESCIEKLIKWKIARVLH